MTCRNRIVASLFRMGSCLLLAVAAGCDEADGIRQYTIPHQEVRKFDSANSQEIPPADVSWFFKVLGPANSVEQQLRPLTEILRSLRFDARGEPIVELPPK